MNQNYYCIKTGFYNVSFLFRAYETLCICHKSGYGMVREAHFKFTQYFSIISNIDINHYCFLCLYGHNLGGYEN